MTDIAGAPGRSGRRGLRWAAGVLLAAGLLVGPAPSAQAAPVPRSEAAYATSVTAAATLPARRGNPRAYRFAARAEHEPVHWDRCKPIGWRMSRHRAPHHALRQTKMAVHRVAKMSGLRFAYRGFSKVRPYIDRDYQRRTRLVIGWLRPGESKLLQRRSAGYGGPRYYTTGSRAGEIVKAFVQLNARLNGDLANGFGRGPRAGYQGTKGHLLMHEIGHAVGLDHVRDRRQIMYPRLTRKRATFGAGDAHGLRRVGQARSCF